MPSYEWVHDHTGRDTYVAFDPLTNIDPDGLILFAFDGTENTDDLQFLADRNSSLSNVVRFRDLYNDGVYRYVTGVGTVDRNIPTEPINAPDGDTGFNWSGAARIERMVRYFDEEADNTLVDTDVMNVDIIGFSRGAAQARDFANRIMASAGQADANGNYRYAYTTMVNGVAQDRCQLVNFRFMGLWDTVLSVNLSGHNYSLGVPASFRHVAHAVALNEYRRVTGAGGRANPTDLNSLGSFALESIMGGALPSGQTRVEMGFVGAHADIGGGFGATENSLSIVALAWMLEQARVANVPMNPASLTIDASPILHDKSNNIQTGQPTTPGFLNLTNEDRIVRYRDGTTTTQRQMTGTGLTYGEVVNQNFISYTPRAELARNPIDDTIVTNHTGTVNAANYIAWLRDNGYDLGNLSVQ
jgi:hypothetical protein